MGKRKKGPGAITREEMRAMHGAVKTLEPRPGSEAFSLMCSLGSNMQYGNVGPEKARELRERFIALKAAHELPGSLRRMSWSNDVAAMDAHLSAITRQELPAPQPRPAAPQTDALPRGGMPPDWRAAYVHWGVKMRQELAGDEAALKTFRHAEKVLWELFQAEVEGQLP